MKYKRIVINEPHASIEGLYDEHLGFWDIDEEFFQRCCAEVDGLAYRLPLSRQPD